MSNESVRPGLDEPVVREKCKFKGKELSKFPIAPQANSHPAESEKAADKCENVE